jgi:hypothetical protein
MLAAISFLRYFVLPFAAVLTVLLLRYAIDRRDAWGLIAGFGAVLLYVGVSNIGTVPCPQSTISTTGGPGSSATCGGMNASPWLAVGATLVVGALVAYWVVRRRGMTATSGT